ncbi:dihydrolipoamide acetyltransferase family protein [Sphingopyxis alaskensis]|jgi:pyruvate dehydrogenase E2 component (dihydrolipoamide acetyltransferase)|uniref:dihydrolipoamide acetyltransferase family protein n=1 Tax=Sphingopyxis alaskensis TaxID=117207 RepID=UPI00204018D5|nr:dihydrolipoamide acetyltransferase family protein [Sphingopyxis alaskensis]MCM3420238.1 2-oxo acid dehydrogenase subunit E2 [Sphingopyxis alaskensis]
MSIEIKMPALSPTMEKGTLAKWLIAEGDTVRSGDIIAEIETDKATMEFEAADDGCIAKLFYADGSDDIPVGAVIALISAGEEEEDSPPPVASATDAPPAPPAPEPAMPPAPVPAPVIDAPRARLADKVKVSPLAARIADAKGIDLAPIAGTGPYGRIVKADLRLPEASPALVRGEAVLAAAVPVELPPPADIPYRTIANSTMRRTIARRLTESKQSAPHFYLTARCRLDALLALRAELNAARGEGASKLSVNDFLVKAMALAMIAEPGVNVRFSTDATYWFERVDLSIAVAIEGGLVTPVIRDAGVLSVSAIAAQARELAERARGGMLTPQDYAGGTASLSNLGMFGIDAIVPVLNPPQALILGVGAGIEQPWKVDGGIALATIMDVTASFDHRAIDGATGARFMAALRGLIENPLRILA